MNFYTILHKVNIFRKLYIFRKYFMDNFQNKEFRLIFYSLKYIATGKSNPKDIIVKTNIGKFYLRKNTIDFKFANSAYEENVMDLIKKLLPQTDLFLDIGSNIGTYAIYAGMINKRTIAFEPIETNYKTLLKNIELNQLENFVSAYHIGLSNKKETIRFFFNSVNTGASGIMPEGNSQPEIEVKVKPLDSLGDKIINDAKKVLMKIDVEEMEVEALLGMTNTLKNIPELTIIIENKHCGAKAITDVLDDIGEFTYSKVDNFNMMAIKSQTK